MGILTRRGVIILAGFFAFIFLSCVFNVILMLATLADSSSPSTVTNYPETREDFMHRCMDYHIGNPDTDVGRWRAETHCSEEWRNR